MKKVFIATLASLITALSFGQKISNERVPLAVQEAMTKAFPQAARIKWEKENDLFEAEFNLNKEEYSALFSPEGKWLETEMEIEVEALPSAIHQYVSTQLPKHKIKEASKITDASGKITFEAEVGGKDYIFDEKGSFIQSK